VKSWVVTSPKSYHDDMMYVTLLVVLGDRVKLFSLITHSSRKSRKKKAEAVGEEEPPTLETPPQQPESPP